MQQKRHNRIRSNRNGCEINVRSFACSIILLAGLQFLGTSRGHASSVEDADQLYAKAVNAWDRSTSPEVEDLLRRALALQRAALPPTDDRIAQTLNHLGRVFYNRGVARPDSHQFEEAMVWFDEALSLARLAGDQNRTLLSDYVSDLAAAQREAGQAARALPNACEGLHIRLSLRPLLTDRILRSLVNLARTRAALGKQREADRLFHDVKSIQTTPRDGYPIGKAPMSRTARQHSCPDELYVRCDWAAHAKFLHSALSEMPALEKPCCRSNDVIGCSFADCDLCTTKNYRNARV